MKIFYVLVGALERFCRFFGQMYDRLLPEIDRCELGLHDYIVKNTHRHVGCDAYGKQVTAPFLILELKCTNCGEETVKI